MSKLTRAPDGLPVAFDDLPPEAFPVEVAGVVDGEIIWRRTIEPYVLVDIPAAPERLQGRVAIRIKYATGEVVWQQPMSAEESRAHIERRIRESQGGR
jgi:hypothetical protein